MATRAITTNQPDVSCDVCGRRLLRGERPDVFLASGSRRTVCELCIPRATGEGWTRESEASMVGGARGARSRKGRSLLDRLRQRRGEEQRAGVVESLGVAWARGRGGEPSRARADSWQDAPAGGWAPDEDYWSGEEAEDLLTADQRSLTGEGSESLAAMDAYGPVSNGLRGGGQHDGAQHDGAQHDGAQHDAAQLANAHAAAVQPGADIVAVQAVEIFNASECATRAAGIARALGEPSVTVGVAAEEDNRVRIVVAWELCWYRYEVDLGQRPATIAAIGEGTELEELPPEDRLVNAVADERGKLSLLR